MRAGEFRLTPQEVEEIEVFSGAVAKAKAAL
jgi:hypothetical protein